MKRTLAAILAVSMILSVTACNDSTASGNGDNSGNTTSSASGSGDTEQKLRSNPIAVDADGNIDMDVALKYETDVDALIKSSKQRPRTAPSLYPRTQTRKHWSFSTTLRASTVSRLSQVSSIPTLTSSRT